MIDSRLKKVKKANIAFYDETYFLSADDVDEMLEEYGVENAYQLCVELDAVGCVNVSISSRSSMSDGIDGYLFFF